MLLLISDRSLTCKFSVRAHARIRFFAVNSSKALMSPFSYFFWAIVKCQVLCLHLLTTLAVFFLECIVRLNQLLYGLMQFLLLNFQIILRASMRAIFCCFTSGACGPPVANWDRKRDPHKLKSIVLKLILKRYGCSQGVPCRLKITCSHAPEHR